MCPPIQNSSSNSPKSMPPVHTSWFHIHNPSISESWIWTVKYVPYYALENFSIAKWMVFWVVARRSLGVENGKIPIFLELLEHLLRWIRFLNYSIRWLNCLHGHHDNTLTHLVAKTIAGTRSWHYIPARRRVYPVKSSPSRIRYRCNCRWGNSRIMFCIGSILIISRTSGDWRSLFGMYTLGAEGKVGETKSWWVRRVIMEWNLYSRSKLWKRQERITKGKCKNWIH